MTLYRKLGGKTDYMPKELRHHIILKLTAATNSFSQTDLTSAQHQQAPEKIELEIDECVESG
ncbi:hypothetical protein [Pantanalinema sp. GBBB05]|uniref:hypothetical protein n=1 Tax=Pantanalinema sp. GBBB05 TaxID=2604139 RepID=UPI001D58F771|nr:hypothetical protein [Pantanalinema sp. GBBB05]